MSGFLLIRAEDARRVPWKNGRGVTEEIAVGPDGATFEAGDFAWRVSRASVAEPGPFSAFPGIDRVLVVTDGAGLRLRHGGAPGVATVLPFVPHRFSGDDATDAELVGGPVRDFNVLTRRGRARAEVEVVRGGAASVATDGADEILIHAAHSASLGSAAPERAQLRSAAAAWSLAPGDTLRVTAAGSDAGGELLAVPPTGGAGALLVVRIHLVPR